jgi:hypothetical protein
MPSTLVREPELARALAQPLLALGGVEGQRRGGRGRDGRRGVLVAGEAAALPVLRDVGERVHRAAGAGLLAVHQRAVGARDEVGGADPRLPRGHARRRAGGVALDELGDRGGDPVDGAGGDLLRHALLGVGHDQRELVAAVAGGDVVGADPAAQRGADPPQHLVARQVAVQVVDLLEVVEVDQHQRGRLGGAAGGALDLAPELLVQRGVVEAAGQGVGLRGAGEVGVRAGVAAGDAGQLREGLQHGEVLRADGMRALPADAEHAVQLAVPAERDRERRVHAPERRVGGQGGDRLVVVGQHRAAALDDPAGEAGPLLERPADELRRQARDAADDEAGGRRAVVDGGVVGVQQAGGLLADAVEQRLEVERLVERLRRARERELAGHARLVRDGGAVAVERGGGRVDEHLAELVVLLEARARARAREQQDVGADGDQLAGAALRLRREGADQRVGGVSVERPAGRAGGDEVLQRGQCRDVVRVPVRLAGARGGGDLDATVGLGQLEQQRRRHPEEPRGLLADGGADVHGIGRAARGREQARHRQHGVRGAAVLGIHGIPACSSRPPAASLYTGRPRRARNAPVPRRGGRVAEGTRLLSEYGAESSIAGSNPALSAGQAAAARLSGLPLRP